MPAANVDISVNVRGVREVQRKLRDLGKAAGLQAIEAGLREAAGPIIQGAKSRAPDAVVREGIQIVNLERDGSGMHVEVGLPGGRHPWFYGLFIEKGTGPRFHKSGKFTGSMPASPFLRPAFDARKKQARDAYYAEIRRRLEAVARG